jgi:hypothetical protein
VPYYAVIENLSQGFETCIHRGRVTEWLLGREVAPAIVFASDNAFLTHTSIAVTICIESDIIVVFNIVCVCVCVISINLL